MDQYHFKPILPDDVYITIVDRQPSEEELWKGISPHCRGNRATGYEVFDVFASLIRQLGHRDAGAYAARMGLTASQLRMIVQGLSGKTFNEWRDRYLILAAAELLRDVGLNVNETARRLHFSSNTVFSRFFSRHARRQPYEFVSFHRKQETYTYHCGE